MIRGVVAAWRRGVVAWRRRGVVAFSAPPIDLWIVFAGRRCETPSCQCGFEEDGRLKMMMKTLIVQQRPPAARCLMKHEPTVRSQIDDAARPSSAEEEKNTLFLFSSTIVFIHFMDYLLIIH